MIKERVSQVKNYLLLHLILFMYSFGGIFSKLASAEKFLSPKYICFYGIVIINLFVYAILWQQILKKMSLTAAYANKGITVVWGLVLGRVFFSEQLSPVKLAGALIVILGILMVVTENEQ